MKINNTCLDKKLSTFCYVLENIKYSGAIFTLGKRL